MDGGAQASAGFLYSSPKSLAFSALSGIVGGEAWGSCGSC